MSGYDRIYNCLKTKPDQILSTSNAGFAFGTVVTTEPLTVNLHDNGILLEDDSLLLSPYCFDQFIEIDEEFTTSTAGSEDPHYHELNVKLKIFRRGLEKGDIVNMIRSSDKQKYHIIDYKEPKVWEVIR